MTPQSAALVRQFLSSVAGQEWMDDASKAIPKLKLSEVTDRSLYEVSLYEAEGWRKALEHMVISVSQVPEADFGVPPIDTVRD